MVLLSEPPEEVTPGALAALVRYFGAPTGGAVLPAPVLRWLEDLEHQSGPAQHLELRRPLSTMVEGSRLVARLVAVQPGHPGAIVVRSAGSDAP